MAPKARAPTDPTEKTPLNRNQRPLKKNEDPEDLASITDTAVRHGFVRKVFGILGVQLLATFVIACLITIFGAKLVAHNPVLVSTLMGLSSAVLLSVHCVFICFRETMRKSPQNYALLSIFTLAKGVLVGFVCVQFTVQSVLVLLAITATVTLGLMLFAFQTSFDFTGFAPYMFAVGLVLMLMGLGISISAACGAAGTGPFKVVYIIYASLGALFACFGIILHTQMIVGGKKSQHRYRLDDYCMAAISLYADIVRFFHFLLMLFGIRKS